MSKAGRAPVKNYLDCNHVREQGSTVRYASWYAPLSRPWTLARLGGGGQAGGEARGGGVPGGLRAALAELVALRGKRRLARDLGAQRRHLAVQDRHARLARK